MLDNELNDFCELWSSVCEMATGKAPSQKALEFTFGALMDLRLDEIHLALEKHANHPDTCDYWPKAGSVRRAIHGGGDLVSQQAWQKVYHALRGIGRHSDIKFEDQLIMKTIEDMGGWQVLLDTSDETIGYKENDFKKTYRGYTNSGLNTPAPEVFRGLENQQRLNSGQPLKAFPSYEKQLAASKGKSRDDVLTLPRPIDAMIEEGAKKPASADKVLSDMKALLGMVKIENKGEA